MKVEGHALPEDTPDPEAWRARVATSPLATGGGAPLVLSGGRLYLARYHQHQSRLAHAVAERAGRTLQPADPAALRLGLQALFPDAASATDGVDRQQLAALVACLHPFAVITGGPMRTPKAPCPLRCSTIGANQASRAVEDQSICGPSGR